MVCMKMTTIHFKKMENLFFAVFVSWPIHLPTLWLSYHNFRPNSLVVNETFKGKKLPKRFIPKRVNNIVRINKVISEEIFLTFADSEAGAKFNDDNAVFAGEDNEKIKVVDKKSYLSLIQILI